MKKTQVNRDLEYENLCKQMEKLESYIINNIDGEPKENEGVIDTAIRLLGEKKE